MCRCASGNVLLSKFCFFICIVLPTIVHGCTIIFFSNKNYLTEAWRESTTHGPRGYIFKTFDIEGFLLTICCCYLTYFLFPATMVQCIIITFNQSTIHRPRGQITKRTKRLFHEFSYRSTYCAPPFPNSTLHYVYFVQLVALY